MVWWGRKVEGDRQRRMARLLEGNELDVCCERKGSGERGVPRGGQLGGRQTEVKCGVPGDALGTLLAVCERSGCEGKVGWLDIRVKGVRRKMRLTDGELALSTDSHAGDSLVPACGSRRIRVQLETSGGKLRTLDDLSAAEGEDKGGALGVGAGRGENS